VQLIFNEIKILKPDEMKGGLLVQFSCFLGDAVKLEK